MMRMKQDTLAGIGVGLILSPFFVAGVVAVARHGAVWICASLCFIVGLVVLVYAQTRGP